LIVGLISGAIQMLISIIGAGLNVVTSVFFAIWSGIVSYLSTAFRSIVNGAGGMLNDLVGFFGGIGGRVIGALGNIGGTLIGAGKALIQGFIDGIKSMVGAIGDAVGGVMDFAKQFFPHSPAKRGPFSGSGYTSFSGQALAKDFAAGIASQNDVVADAAAGIMTSATLTGNVGISSALLNNPSRRSGTVNNWTINQVDDPIGTAHAVTRRQLALSS
jgi:phage-related protein